MPPSAPTSVGKSTQSSDDDDYSTSESDVPPSSDVAMRTEGANQTGGKTERNRRRKMKRKHNRSKAVDPALPARVDVGNLASLPQGIADPIKVKLHTKDSGRKQRSRASD